MAGHRARLFHCAGIVVLRRMALNLKDGTGCVSGASMT
jgi:hypothetical protein